MAIATFSTIIHSASVVSNADSAAQDLKRQMAGMAPKQIIYFAGGGYEPERIAAAMKDAFPGALTLGCSSSGEIINGLFTDHSVTAMAFDDDVCEFFAAAVIKKSDAATPAAQVEEVFKTFEAKLGRSMADLEHDKYFGLVIADGRNHYIEPVLERAGDLTSVTFIGGAACDGGRFAYTPVYFDGKVCQDAVILALAKPRGRFSLLKTEGLDLQDKTYTVTGVDEENRLVTHIDGKPAADVYCEAIGIDKGEKATLFGVLDAWPFGLMAGDTPFLRVVVEVLPDGALRFLNSVKEGMRLKVGRPTDIVDSTRASMIKAREELGSISAVLHISCLSRLFVLAQQKKQKDFEDIFAGYPSAGFFSHGEYYIAIANITSVMIVFA